MGNEETGEEGLLMEYEDAFYVWGEQEFTWFGRRCNGRRLRSGPRKGNTAKEKGADHHMSPMDNLIMMEENGMTTTQAVLMR